MKNNLEWDTVYYNEELDTDNSVLEWECTQEALYKNGYLIRHIHCDGINRTESMTFIHKINKEE
jgi:hypothetical protein